MLASISSKVIHNFIWRNIIYCFGLPHIVSNNDTHFTSQNTIKFLFGLESETTSLRFTNHTIIEGLKKKVKKNKFELSYLLDEILRTYYITPREATQQSPNSLVYDMKVVISMELVLPSLRLINYNEDINNEERRVELKFDDEA
jgi:hypothetical protein